MVRGSGSEGFEIGGTELMGHPETEGDEEAYSG